MRSDVVCRRSRRRKRHFPADFHLHAIRLRLHGRFLRGYVKQNRLSRRRRHAQIFRNATHSLLDNHGCAYGCVDFLHKAYACVGQRHSAERSRLQRRVHLLFRDFSRNGRATVLQFHNQHIEKYRRLVHAARFPFHLHDYEHLA